MAKKLEGTAELAKQLNNLHATFAAKLLRQAVGNAVLPIVKAARLRIPVGDVAHRTYLGNLVAPGFAKRSIGRSTKVLDGMAVAFVGVKKEAFYATQFVEVGTSKMEEQAWLVPALVESEDAVVERLKQQLKAKIKRATTG